MNFKIVTDIIVNKIIIYLIIFYPTCENLKCFNYLRETVKNIVLKLLINVLIDFYRTIMDINLIVLQK